MQSYSSPEIVNIGWGEDVSILELAQLIKEVVGYDGEIIFDSSKPDGTPRKLLDTTRMQALGWIPSISLTEGLKETYDWFQNSESLIRV
jgi:GDP-L-fucose synthase